MPFSDDHAVNQWVLSAVVMIFLVWGVIAAVIGAGLMAFSEAMFRLFGRLDYSVSTRKGMKPLSMAHDIGHFVHRHRRLFGALFVACAAYSLYSLVVRFDGLALVSALNLPYPRAFVAWVLESARWSLIVFGALAVTIGVMLGLFPASLAKIEVLANQWISVRRMAGNLDSTHLPLDRLVRAFPRSAGSVILAGSLFVVANAAVAWSGIR